MAADFHSHAVKSAARTLVSAALNEFPLTSLEFHPWRVAEDFTALPAAWLAEAPRCAALGETGLDKARGPSLAAQRRAFGAVLQMAEQWRKPVVIHCVRAWDELIAARKLHPGLRMLVHGFRGSRELFDGLRR